MKVEIPLNVQQGELVLKLMKTGLWGRTQEETLQRIFDMGLIDAQHSLPFDPMDDEAPGDEWKRGAGRRR